jgi:hypothetical protein
VYSPILGYGWTLMFVVQLLSEVIVVYKSRKVTDLMTARIEVVLGASFTFCSCLPYVEMKPAILLGVLAIAGGVRCRNPYVTFYRKSIDSVCNDSPMAVATLDPYECRDIANILSTDIPFEFAGHDLGRCYGEWMEILFCPW